MPNNQRDCAYLIDMISCCEDILDFTQGIDQNRFIADKMRRLATERQLETLGEAANHCTETLQHMYSQIPWSKIIGLRNKLAHDYGEILSIRIWNIAVQFIPVYFSTCKK
jgi:uncharacterized protein with HEPN domain